ncbi:MAG: DUF3298 and DUF4163 domain-containing protein [Chlorobi bacterium]|nr:DUF3298 and DUF4163 domain-containing protein [Chlorobiota bacterium]
MKQLLIVLSAIIITAGCTNENKGIKNKGDKRTVTESGVWGSMDVSFPVYKNSFIDSVINTFVSDQIKEFMALTDYAVDDSMKYEMTVKYEEYFARPGVLSVVFNIYQFTGGAHGNNFIVSLVFDTENNKILKLSDFVKAGEFTKLRSFVRDKLKDNLEYDESVDEGTATPEDFSAFAVTDDKLIFWFSPYQVASYADGLQRVEVPRN